MLATMPLVVGGGLRRSARLKKWNRVAAVAMRSGTRFVNLGSWRACIQSSRLTYDDLVDI